MAQRPLMQRAAPALGIAWTSLGLFFVWEAAETGARLGYLLGLSALAVGVANFVIARRRR